MVKNTSTNNDSYVTLGYSDLAGAVGTAVGFKIRASIELESSDFLFNTIGQSTVSGGGTELTINQVSATNYAFIDSIIRITGVTTGYSLDIPVRYIRKV